jgi:hypothetical protein
MRGRGVFVPMSCLALIAALFAGAGSAADQEPAYHGWDGTGDLPAGVVELSHEWWVPYMDKGALNIPHGIRPGAWLRMGNAHCTAAFVLTDPQDNLYITTSGHCTQSTGQRAFVKQGAVNAAVGEWLAFGTVVARWPSGYDAALIRVDSDKHDLVKPTMSGWGGPTGVATTRPADALHYGWGWITWQDHYTRCRAAVTTGWSATTWWIRTDTYGGGGDSGSGVMGQDGLALGILNWATNIQPDPVGGAFYAKDLGGIRMDVAIDLLTAQSGIPLVLVTGGDTTMVPLPAPLGTQCHPEPPVIG